MTTEKDIKEPIQEVHILIDTQSGQEYQQHRGALLLQKSGSIRVSVKEYLEAFEKITIEENTERAKIEKARLNTEAYNKLNAKERAIYDEKVKGFNNGFEQRADRKKKLAEDFKNVAWVWQLIGSNMNKSLLSQNEDLGIGISEQTFNVNGYRTLTFPALLEGGGVAWLEPYIKKADSQQTNLIAERKTAETGIQGKPPYGCYVSAKGTPKVIDTVWTDKDFNPIENTHVKFGSFLLLHIYTNGMYGHEVELTLIDRDTFDLNDRLPFSNEEDRAASKKFSFTREVNVWEIKPFENGRPGVSGFLVDATKEERNKSNKKQYVQKCVVEVYVDAAWEEVAGTNLKIYPTIKSVATEAYFEDFPRKYLEVDNEGKDYSVQSIQSNNPIFIDNIETNIAHFHLCKYEKIFGTFENEVYDIFPYENASIVDNVNLQIVTDDQHKKLSLLLDGVATSDCDFKNKAQWHKDHMIVPLQPEHFKELKISADKISFNIAYPKPSDYDAIKMAWLPNIVPLRYAIDFNSCRFTKHLDVTVFPDVKYTFNAHLGVKEDEYLYVTQTRNYKYRKYSATRKNGTMAARKKANKGRRDSYQEDVDKSVTKTNLTEKYKFSIGMEYKFGDREPEKIELTTVKTLKNILETTMYIYDTIDSYLFGSEMKAAEKSGAKGYHEKKRQRERKKKSAFMKGGLPFRLEVTPPKFTGGVTWSYKPSSAKPNLLGVNYQFKLGALPLVGVTGRLDLLFAAQFILYFGQVVSAIDKAIAAINTIGEGIKSLGIGTMEAEYYFDLVVSSQLDIDVTNGATYHTIDGFTQGHVQIESPLEIKLEAGGSIKLEMLEIKAEAVIHAEATAKFKLYYLSDKKDFLTFEFEGVEAVVKAKLSFEEGSRSGAGKESNSENNSSEDTKPIPILNGFNIDIPLFKKEIPNPHKDEEE